MTAYSPEGKMTREEFIAAYCERSGYTWAEMSKFYDALPCQCDAEQCEGWAMVSLDPLAIKGHKDLYWPQGLPK